MYIQTEKGRRLLSCHRQANRQTFSLVNILTMKNLKKVVYIQTEKGRRLLSCHRLANSQIFSLVNILTMKNLIKLCIYKQKNVDDCYLATDKQIVK